MNRAWLDGKTVADWLAGTDDSRLSFAVALVVSFGAYLILAAVTAATGLDPRIGLAAFALVVAVVSWWSAPATAVSVAILAFCFVNGFVLERGGNLAWHGDMDIARLGALIVVGLTVTNLGQDHAQRARRRRIRAALSGRQA